MQFNKTSERKWEQILKLMFMKVCLQHVHEQVIFIFQFYKYQKCIMFINSTVSWNVSVKQITSNENYKTRSLTKVFETTAKENDVINVGKNNEYLLKN